jgi:UDP-sugar diphosphatase
VLEECGFDVPVAAVKRVTSYVSSTGISGSQHSMFVVEVDESMRATGGGGVA